MSSFFTELKRRNVFRVGVAYVITAWLVAQVADLALESFGAPDWVMKTVLLLLVVGFPLALVFAWAFEKTPEGIKLEKNVDRSQSITPQTGRKLDRTIIALLVVAVIVLVADRVISGDGKAPPSQAASEAVTAPVEQAAAAVKSIAVLPFVDMSAAGDSVYFADGLSEELLNLLAKIKELRVAGRTSSFAFKGQNQDLRGIGEQLSVEHILEGSVRKAGNKIRVTAQLVSARDGYHIWSETYDRELTDIFAIQDDIASHVVQALKLELLGGEPVVVSQSGTSVPEAYNAYLLGLHKMNDFSFAALQESRGYFQRTVGLDPGYAPGYVGLARVANEMANTGLISQAEFIATAEPALQRAVELEPDNAEAYAALGNLRAAQGRFEETDAAYRRSLELNPSNVHALTSYGDFLANQGEFTQARGFTERALELDPLSNRVLWNAGLPDFWTGNQAGAMPVLERMRAIDSKAPQTLYGEAFLYLSQGRLDLAIPLFRRSMALDPDDFELVAHLAALHLELGQLELAGELVDKALAMGPGEPFPLAVQAAYFLKQGNAVRATEIARAAAARGLETRHASEWIFLNILRLSAAQRGDDAEYLEQVRQLTLDHVHDDAPRIVWWWDVFGGVHLSYAYRQLEREQERTQLEQAIRSKIYGVDERLRSAQLAWAEVALLAMDGQEALALDKLEQGVGGGLAYWWMVEFDPLFASLSQTERFRQIMDRYRQRLAAQRQALEAADAGARPATGGGHTS